MKGLLPKVLGVVTIIVGVVIIVITSSIHFKYSTKMNELLENRIIFTSDSINSTNSSSISPSSDSIESDIANFSIEVMEEDQKIAEIKQGTPIVNIPSLGITVPVINGTDDYSLKLGVGKFEHSVDMGERGNFAIAGHSSTIYNCIFNDLENIKLLDVIECYNSEGVLFKYYVTNTFKTNPDNIGVTFSSDETTMTIVTCTDNGTRRFIVSAMLMSDDELIEYERKLKQMLIDKAITIADSSYTIDVLFYFNEKSSITKIPYRIRYCNFENIDSFFTNYVLVKDRLNINEHQIDTRFYQSVGFDFISLLTEVIEE